MHWSFRLAGIAAAFACSPASAEVVGPPPSPFAQCDAAIEAAAKLPGRVPDKLLPSIARVESGRLDGATGRVRPWPWTINVDGVGYFYDTKEQVISAVQTLQAKGKRSIDVGCMQVNLMHHPKAFAGLEEAFDPIVNARYAVRFLVSLYAMTKDWPLATAYYHSSTPDLGEEYQRLVFGRVMTPMGGTGGGLKTPANPYGAWQGLNERYAAIPPMSLIYGAFPQKPPPRANFGGIPMLSVGSLATFAPAKPFGTKR